MNEMITSKADEDTKLSNVTVATDQTGVSISPQNLADVARVAVMMANSDVGVPAHLRNKEGACLRIVMQALKWDFDPFAVADKSYIVKDKIAYEAQLITAVINTRSGIEGRLKYEFEGEGADRVCICTGKLGGEVLVYRSPPFGKIEPKNSPLWKNDPDQQHCYFSARSWARRHCSEVLLGVYDREEVQGMRDVTPEPKQSMLDRLPAKSEADEGFDVEHVIEETTSADPETTSMSQSEEETGGETVAPETPSVAPIVGAAKRLLGLAGSFAADVEEDPSNADDCIDALNNNVASEKENVPEQDHEQLKVVAQSCRAIIRGKTTYDNAIGYFAGVFEVEEAALRAE